MAGVGLFEAALAAAVAMSLVVLVATVRQLDAPSAPYLAAMLVGSIIWSGGTIVQRQTVDAGVTHALGVLIFVGIFLVVGVYPLFALAFSGYRDLISRRLLGLLAVVPVGLLLLMVTDIDGTMLWEFRPDGPALLDAEGPGFWTYVAYAYFLNLAATVLLLRAAVRSSRLYQSQVAAVVLAVAAPWVSNVLFLFGPLAMDPTPIAFAASGIALFYAMQRYGLLDLAPVARETLVDTVDAGMVVLDEDGQVLDTNAAFRARFGLDDDPIGTGVEEVLTAHPAVLETLDSLTDGSRVVEATIDGDSRFFEIRASPLAADESGLVSDGSSLGTLYLLHDVTARERREQRLRESEQRYRTLAENFPRGVVSLFDEDRRYYLVEGGVFESIDLDESDFEGKRIEEVHDPSYVERFGDSFEGVFDGERHTFEFTHAGRAYRTRLVPVTDDGGEVVAGMAMTTDITELKERERELERYETVVETVPDGVFLVDEDATVITANRSGARMLGYEPGDFEGRSISSLVEAGVFAPGVRERYEELVAALLSSETTDDELTFTHEVTPRDGESRVVEAHVALLPYDREYRGLVAAYRDVTDRERVRRELERQNEQLEQFASVVSHDLRNPLNVANSRVELARETGDLDHLDSAVEAHERMDRLIDDILRLARQGDLVTETEPVSLAAVAREAWSHVQAPDATLTVDTDGEVAADRSRLTQLLQNCFHNAVQHGDGDVTVRVGLLDGSATDDGTGFFVADDGPGIEPERHEEVFEYGTTDHVAGTGLGLAIVQEIAEGHGWHVDVTESETSGARFEFRPGDGLGASAPAE